MAQHFQQTLRYKPNAIEMVILNFWIPMQEYALVLA
jgi:hypothetical protein